MAGELPPPPPGFTLDAPSGGGMPPPPPPGFKLDPMPAPSKPDVSATGSGLGDFISGIGQGFNNRVMPVLNAPNRLFGRVAEPIARGLGFNPPPSMTAAGADAQSAAQQKEFTPIDTSQSKYGRYGQAGGDAAAVGAGMTLGLPLLGPAALAPGAVPEAVLPTVARALTAAPTSAGGLLGQAETNIAAGAGGEGGKDMLGSQIGDKAAEQLGQFTGGFAPSLMPAAVVAGLSKVLGLPLAGVAKGAASRFISESPTYETRQAEKQAYLGRGQGDTGAPLEAPSGKDYSNPATPAPPKPGIVDNVRDWATNQRIQNSHADIGRRLDELRSRPEVAANLLRSRELEDTIPGLKLTTAEQTGYEPLILEQKRIESNMAGDDLVGRQKTFDQNQKAIGNYADTRIAPTAGPADQATGDAARGIVQSRELTAAEKAAQAEDKIRGVTKSLPTVPRQESGAGIRQGYENAQQAADQTVKQNRQAVVDAGQGVTLPTQDLHNGIQADLQNLGTSLTDPAIPPSVKRLLGRTATPGGVAEPKAGLNVVMDSKPAGPPTADIEGLLQAREDTNVALRRAQASMDLPGKQSADSLMAVRNRLDDEIGRIEQQAGPGSDVAAKMKAYREHYANEYAPNHSQGLGLDVRKADANRQQALQDSDVTNRVLNNNDVEATLQNKRVNPTGVGRIATVKANLDDLRRSTVDPKTGMIKEGGVRDWVAKNQDRLAADPELKKLVEGKDPQKLYDALNGAHAESQANADSAISEMFAKGKRSDSRAIDETTTNLEKMRAVKDEASKDPELDQAFKRAVWERTIANPTEALSDPVKKQALNIAYGDNPQHLRDLQDISDALTKSSAAGRAKGAATDFRPPTSAINDITGSSASSVLNKLWGLNTGRTSKSWLGLDIGLRALNNFTAKDYERALKTAIYNPEVARTMAAGIKAGRLTPPAQHLLSQYILAAPAASATRPDNGKSP